MARMFNPPHPGEIVKESLDYLGMSAREFARHLAVSPTSVTRILNKQGPITPEMAVRIAAVMPGPRASTWLSIQAEWDLWQIEKNIDLSQLTPIKIPVSQKRYTSSLLFQINDL